MKRGPFKPRSDGPGVVASENMPRKKNFFVCLFLFLGQKIGRHLGVNVAAAVPPKIRACPESPPLTRYGAFVRKTNDESSNGVFVSSVCRNPVLRAGHGECVVGGERGGTRDARWLDGPAEKFDESRDLDANRGGFPASRCGVLGLDLNRHAFGSSSVALPRSPHLLSLLLDRFVVSGQVGSLDHGHRELTDGESESDPHKADTGVPHHIGGRACIVDILVSHREIRRAHLLLEVVVAMVVVPFFRG